MHSNQDAGAVENKAILRVIAPTEEMQRITSGRNEKLDHQETNGNGDQITETNRNRDQLSGNGREPTERGGRRHMH
jgi:hypothetical protein